MKLWTLVVLGVATAVSAGCSGNSGPPRKSTVKVKGILEVNGQPPMSPMQIECHNAAGMDTQMPSVSQSISEPEGTFEISTYEKGDGIPAGDYTLTVTWRVFNTMSMMYSGEDRLNGKYSDPKTSTIKFTVKDQPVDLGKIELKTE